MKICCLGTEPAVNEALAHFCRYLAIEAEVSRINDLADLTGNAAVDLLVCQRANLAGSVNGKWARDLVAAVASQVSVSSAALLVIADTWSDYERIILKDAPYVWTAEDPPAGGQLICGLRETAALAGARAPARTARRTLIELISAGKDDEALAFARESPALERESHPNAILLAELLCRLQKYQEALAEAKRALSYERESIRARETLIAIYRAIEAYTEFDAAVNDAMQMPLQHALFYAAAGDAAFRKADFAAAQARYQKALDLDTTLDDAREGLLAVDLALGRVESAQAMLATTQMGEPLELARFCNEKAVTLVRAGNFDAAEKAYRTALELLGNDPVVYKVWMNLGLCLYKAKRGAAALVCFQRCEKLAPADYTKARPYIERLTAKAGA